MGRDKTFELLKLLLEDINDSADRLKGIEQNVPSIELDLLGQQLISAYGMLQRLRRLGDVNETTAEAAPNSMSYSDYRQMHEQQEAQQQQYGAGQESYQQVQPEEEVISPEARTVVPQVPIKNVEEQESPVKQQGDPQVEEKPEETVVSAAEETLPEPEEPAKDKMPVAEKPKEEEKAPEKEQVEEPVAKEIKNEEAQAEEDEAEVEKPDAPSKKSLHEKLGAGRMSLHERLSQNKKPDNLSSRIGLKPITDLKSAISVNKRIAFVNELFNGDQREYKKAIDFLNKTENYSEAKFYISSELKHKFNWSEGNDLYQELQHLVKRKFV